MAQQNRVEASCLVCCQNKGKTAERCSGNWGPRKSSASIPYNVLDV